MRSSARTKYVIEPSPLNLHIPAKQANCISKVKDSYGLQYNKVEKRKRMAYQSERKKLPRRRLPTSRGKP
jgi:hypothetical protein